MKIDATTASPETIGTTITNVPYVNWYGDTNRVTTLLNCLVYVRSNIGQNLELMKLIDKKIKMLVSEITCGN